MSWRYTRAVTENPDDVELLRALAHPVRWGILRRLAAEPGICACDFTEFFDVSQPTISAHLKVLRSAGLVNTTRNGTTICYRIAPGQLAKDWRPARAHGRLRRHRRRRSTAAPLADRAGEAVDEFIFPVGHHQFP